MSAGRVCKTAAAIVCLGTGLQSCMGASAAPAAPSSVRGLADYAAYRELELIDWRKANETVSALGGHAGHVLGQGTVQQGRRAGEVDTAGRNPAPDSGRP
ncbi:MAG: hypothetical protein NZ524_07315 [Thiobacillaceae bacterium]|nr:hypothetical protein [Thiobacillaceae bacterium]MCX7673675.1 hypothetical protein [Thiobacillaceae bacterium]MDW8323770.1 hypothetical protein [Burkholderiales bacterium]